MPGCLRLANLLLAPGLSLLCVVRGYVLQRIEKLSAEQSGTTASLRSEVDKVTGERDELAGRVRKLEAANKAAGEELSKATSAKDKLSGEVTKLSGEKSKVTSELSKVTSAKDKLAADVARQSAEKEKLIGDLAQSEAEREKVAKQAAALESAKATMTKVCCVVVHDVVVSSVVGGA